MSTRAYEMPITTDGGDTIGKYQLTDLSGLIGPLEYVLANNEPICLAFFDADANPSQDTLVSAELDVIAFPLNLDTAVGAVALAATQLKLETLNVPGTWITAATLWRVVLRALATYIDFSQNMQANGWVGSLFAAGRTLNTTFGTLTVAQRNIMLAAAHMPRAGLPNGYDTTGITGSTTLRAALKSMMDQNINTWSFGPAGAPDLVF